MAFLDMRTILFIYILTDMVCLAVVISLWLQSRKRFEGTGLWVWDFLLQTVGMALIALRGVAPAWLSITAAQAMVMIGSYCGYLALSRYAGEKTSQYHNYVILILLTLINIYFTFVEPNLAVRGLNASLGLLIFCFECAWVVFYRATKNMRSLMRGVGLVFAGYCLVNIVRVAEFFIFSHDRVDFMTTVPFDKAVMVTYLMLFILLTYTLALMMNKRLHRDIAFQEGKFSRAFHASANAINLTRLSDGIIIECNDGFKKMTGYEGDEVIGKAIMDLKLWVDDQDRLRIAKELLDGRKVENHECRFRKKAGEMITGLFSADIIAIGSERFVLSSVSDITERKRMEESLQKSEHRLRRTLDSMLEGCQILDSDGRYVYINETAAGQGHRPLESFIGRRQTDLFPGIEKTTLFEMERLCLEQKVSRRFVNEFVYPDGSVGWFDLSIQPVPEGIFILSIDISERRQTEASLRRSEAFLNSIIEQTPYTVWIADEKGTMIRCNPACLKMFNVTEEEVIGKYNAFTDNILREQGLMPQVERAFYHGETARFEVAYDTSRLTNVNPQENVQVYLDATLFPIRNPAGRVTHVVVQNIEISEAKRAQEEVRRLNVELERQVAMRTKELRDTQTALLNLVDDLNESSRSLAEANQSLEGVNRELSAFSYSVSHDLRAPLRTIDGFSSALEEDYGDKLDAEGRDFLQRIRRASQTMGQLIDDMLSLSSVTRTELNCREVDLSRMARNILDGFAEMNPSRCVDICIEADLLVRADDHLMNIALTNLLENAWKFTVKTPSPRIKVGAETKDGAKVIYVRDNGAGFDPQYTGKLFGAFQRLHKSEDYPGTGVGLATVQRIIHRHGGKIWAEGQVGLGAAFYFTLGD